MTQVATITPNQNTGFSLARSTDQLPVLPALPVEESATLTPPPSLRTSETVPPTLPSRGTNGAVTPSTNIDVASIDLSNLGSVEPKLRQLLASDENARNALIERLKSDPKIQTTIEELRKLQGTVLSEQVVKALEAKLRGEGSDAFSINPQTGAPDKLGAWLTVQGAQQLLRSLQELSQKVASGTMTAEDAQFQTTLKLFSGGAAGIVQGPSVLTADYIMQNMAWEWSTYRAANTSRLENRATLVSTSGRNSLVQQVLEIEAERQRQQRAQAQSAAGDLQLLTYSASTPEASSLNSLLSLIKSAEGGYNSMNQGTRGNRIVGSTNDSRQYLGKLLTEMTIGEVKAAQASGRLFAAGAYQFIPRTLPGAAAAVGLSDNDMFSPENQEKMGMGLLFVKRPYLGQYLRGEHSDMRGAMIELAREFASIPHPDTGRSNYGNGNAAHHSVERVRTVLTQARQAFIARGSSFVV